MEFIELFTSSNRLEYYKVVEFLEKNNVNFQKLHEYRLFEETNYRSIGPAIIRILRQDLLMVERLLIEGGFMQNDSDNEIVENQIIELSKIDKELFQNEISSIIGRPILKVIYVLANEYEYDHGLLHSVDSAIVLDFGEDVFLSWEFKEGGYDCDREINSPPSYHISFTNILNIVDKSYRVIDVTENESWKPFINIRIEDIIICTNEINNQKIVTDVIIKSSEKKVAFYSTEEPGQLDGKVRFRLSLSNTWMVVVFDQNVIESSKRVNDPF